MAIGSGNFFQNGFDQELERQRRQQQHYLVTAQQGIGAGLAGMPQPTKPTEEPNNTLLLLEDLS